jgi:glutathione S-transferase
MMQFFTAPGTCALASHIALEEAGAPYTLRRLNFGASEQRGADYLAVNPKGRVPALATDRGTLTETPAILAYIAQSFPAAGLAPSDAFDYAQMQAFNSYLCSTVHVAHAHGTRAARWAAEVTSHADMLQKVPQNMRDAFALIEGKLLAGPWVMGAQFTVADGYLYTVAGWLPRDGVDVAEFPKVAAHVAAMEARPSVQRAKAALV